MLPNHAASYPESRKQLVKERVWTGANLSLRVPTPPLQLQIKLGLLSTTAQKYEISTFYIANPDCSAVDNLSTLLKMKLYVFLLGVLLIASFSVNDVHAEAGGKKLDLISCRYTL